MDAWPREIIRTLRDAGHEAYLAGGCVRDRLLGRTPKDHDVATSARPEEVEVLFESTRLVGAAFGVILVIRGCEFIEVATFRADGPYLDGRRPDSVTYGGMREDAARRDFTVNGLFMDPFSGEIIDHVGGREDLDRRLIRAIGHASDRFAEDRLRLLRAVRFASTLGFEIETETRRAIREAAAEIRVISRERIRDELIRILIGGGAAPGFRLLEDLGLLRVVLPEVAAMVGVPQPPEFHPEGDVWVHVLGLLEGLDRMDGPGPEFALGALLHDVGKPATITHEDRIRCNDHARVGAEMTEEICRDLRLSRAQVARVSSLVRQHMKFLEVRRMRPARLRRFLMQENVEDHLELHRLDCEASHGGLDNYEFCRDRLEEIRREPRPPPRLLTGHDLIAEGFRPGPAFAKILAEVEEAQIENRISTREDALRWVHRHHGSRLEDDVSGPRDDAPACGGGSRRGGAGGDEPDGPGES